MLIGGLMGEVGRWWDGQLVGWLVDEMGGVMGEVGRWFDG